MGDDLRRIIRIGLALLVTAGILFVLYYTTLRMDDLPQQATAQDPQMVIRDWLDAQKLDPAHAMVIDEFATTAQARQRKTWSLLTMPPAAAVQLRERVRDLDSVGGRMVHVDNRLALEDLKLPSIDRSPAWWLDPRTLNAAITVLQEADQSGRIQVTYLGISYATGQAYVCQWSGPATDWKDRPLLRNEAPATRAVALQP